jgi:ribose transport system substrate-binding protein
MRRTGWMGTRQRLIATMLVAVFAIAACGGEEGGDAAAPAAEGDVESVTVGGEEAGDDEEAKAAAIARAEEGARELLDAAVNENEWTGPEDSPTPIEGLNVVVIPEQMASTGAARPAQAIADTGRQLGWSTKILDGQGRPEVQLNAVNAAVDEGADAIALVFVDTTRVQSGVQRAIDAGIPIITLGSLRNTPETVPDVSFDWVRSGEALAQYMVWKSEAELNLLQMKNTDLYITVNGQYKGSQEYLEQEGNCPGCTILTREWSLANFDDPTTGPAAQATATIQGDTDINWVSCFDSCLYRVVNSLNRAGLADRVSGAGFDCNPENVSIIREGGSQKVCFADPREWVAYAVTDNINRMTNGEEPYDYTPAIPVAMFDQEVLEAMSPEMVTELEELGWQGNFDFRSKFEELWGVQ